MYNFVRTLGLKISNQVWFQNFVQSSIKTLRCALAAIKKVLIINCTSTTVSKVWLNGLSNVHKEFATTQTHSYVQKHWIIEARSGPTPIHRIGTSINSSILRT